MYVAPKIQPERVSLALLLKAFRETSTHKYWIYEQPARLAPNTQTFQDVPLAIRNMALAMSDLQRDSCK